MEHRTAVTFAMLAAVFFAAATVAHSENITGNVTWSGTVRVSGEIVVEEGATLTIEPGTTVLVEPAEKGDDGLARSGILVKGSIVADGEPGSPVTFTSAARNPAPGDWGEVQLRGSPHSLLKCCVFSYGGWGVHVHDSHLVIDSCAFRYNSFGGIRGRGDGMVVTGCDISGLPIGIRFWKGGPRITGNRITRNRTGIFFRQSCETAVVRSNDLSENTEYALKLGDLHETGVDASGNWWGTSDSGTIKKLIYDKTRDSYIGSVNFEPVLDGPPDFGVDPESATEVKP